MRSEEMRRLRARRQGDEEARSERQRCGSSLANEQQTHATSEASILQERGGGGAGIPNSGTIVPVWINISH